MNAKIRLLTAWRFAEPDRVPLEIYLYPPARGLPGADRIQAFQEQEADNLRGVAGFDWGFMGLDMLTRLSLQRATGLQRSMNSDP